MKLVELLFWCGVAYTTMLLLIRGLLPSDSTPSISLVGIPLIVVALIIAWDLSRRSSSPTIPSPIASRVQVKEDPVKFLSGQIKIATKASDSYFETIVRTRLRELLITKVSLETGLEKDTTRRTLSDPEQSRELLHDDELYTILYGALPLARARTKMIEKAADLIGAWKS